MMVILLVMAVQVVQEAPVNLLLVLRVLLAAREFQFLLQSQSPITARLPVAAAEAAEAAALTMRIGTAAEAEVAERLMHLVERQVSLQAPVLALQLLVEQQLFHLLAVEGRVIMPLVALVAVGVLRAQLETAVLKDLAEPVVRLVTMCLVTQMSLGR